MTRVCNPKRQPIPFTAADGCECLRVPLAGNRGEAIIEADDMRAVEACGIGNIWSLDSNGNGRRYVRGIRRPCGRAVSIARAVTRAGSGQWARYHDGNPLNLRRGNLYLVEGKSKMDCAALIAKHVEGEPKGLPEISARASNNEGSERHPPWGQRVATRNDAMAFRVQA